MGMFRFVLLLVLVFAFAVAALWCFAFFALVKSIKPRNEIPIPTALLREIGIRKSNPVHTIANIRRVQFSAAWCTTLMRVNKYVEARL